MKKKSKFKSSFNIIQTILIILFGLILIIGPVLMISFNKPYYESYISKTNFIGIDKTEASILIMNSVNFLMHKSELNKKFTENEASHMNDVRKIFDYITITYFVSGVLIIGFLIFLKIKKESFLLLVKPLKYSSFIILGIGILLFLASIINFHVTFTVFHELFFPQGNWSFPEGSLLISLFSEKFFFNTGIIIFIIIMIQSLIIASTTIFIDYKIKYNNNKNK